MGPGPACRSSSTPRSNGGACTRLRLSRRATRGAELRRVTACTRRSRYGQTTRRTARYALDLVSAPLAIDSLARVGLPLREPMPLIRRRKVSPPRTPSSVPSEFSSTSSTSRARPRGSNNCVASISTENPMPAARACFQLRPYRAARSDPTIPIGTNNSTSRRRCEPPPTRRRTSRSARR